MKTCLLNLCLFALGALNAQTFLSLEEALGIALEKNHSVLIAKSARDVQALQNHGANAGFTPTVSLIGSLSSANLNSYQEFNNGQVQDRPGATNFGSALALNADWIVFDGFRMFAVRKRLRLSEELSGVALRQQMENTVYEVIVAYYNVVRLRELIRAAGQNLALYEERRKIAGLRQEIGSGSKVEEMLSRSDENRARANILQLELELLNAKTALNVLLGRGVETDFVTPDTIVVNYHPALEELKRSAYAANTQLRASRQSEAIADLGVREARSNSLPFLSLNGTYMFTRNVSEAGFVALNRQNGLSGSINLRWQLFNGGRNHRLVQERSLSALQQRYATEQVRLTIDGRVYVQYQVFLLNRKIMEMELQNLRDARDVLDISLERYQIGKSGLVETIETQRNLEDVQVRYVNALYNMKVAETELLRINGTLVR